MCWQHVRVSFSSLSDLKKNSRQLLSRLEVEASYMLYKLIHLTNCTCRTTTHAVQLHVPWAALIQHHPASKTHTYQNVGITSNEGQILREPRLTWQCKTFVFYLAFNITVI